MLEFDIVVYLSDFLSNKDFINLSLICKDYRKILFTEYCLKNRLFILKKGIKNLRFIENLSYKIYKLDLNSNKNLKDEDFEILRGINTLNMSNCNQETITDKAFEYLGGMNTFKIFKCIICYSILITKTHIKIIYIF